MAVRGVGLRVIAVATLTVSVLALLTACGAGTGSKAPSHAAPKRPAALVSPMPMIAVSPVSDATRVPVSTEIGTDVANGTVSDVTLASTSGQPVAGFMRDDGSSWVPSTPLQFSQRYTAKVTVVDAAGRTTVATTSFATMPKPATRPISTSDNLYDGSEYGVAMPIVLDFGASIPAAFRARVQSRLFVNSSPAQTGAWSWVSDREIVYRPASYWKPGTTVTFRSTLGGLPVGRRMLDKNRTDTFAIGRDMRFAVTNRNHMITVTSAGKTIERYPISMGKPSTPSWSGQFVIMDRLPATVFDTLDEGPGGYRVAVQYAERLTWSGMFLHSAPWSVYAQGNMNVSHGCVNIGPANARWIFQNSLIGDPVSVSGTPRHVASGNGWTAWDQSWNEFIRGSATPFTVTVPDTRAPSL
jgi:lipoprotein-anchoring transpeptidase ErfK/SrfK